MNFTRHREKWDLARIPFIKPYEAKTAYKEMGWLMELEGKDLDYDAPRIKKANIINGVTLLYCTFSTYHYDDVPQTWHVIIPNKQIQRVFNTHQEYRKYLNSLGMKYDPHLFKMDDIGRYFDDHEVIDWNDLNLKLSAK